MADVPDAQTGSRSGARTPTIVPCDEPLVSVVVPVFNSGEHLQACLTTLAGQSMQRMEIIAVDDCSTDDSPAVLERATADLGVRVITHEGNAGVSVARNTGLLAARGEYIAFMDADDVVAPMMYEELYSAARAADADIAYCGIRVVSSDGTVRAHEAGPLPPGTVHDHEAVRELLHHAWQRRMLWYPFRGLYRRKLLTRADLQFDAGIRKGEDSLFNLQALTLASRVVSIDEALYDYRKHPSSATARPLTSEADNLERLGRAVTQFYRDNGFDKRAFDDFYGHVLRSDLPTALVRLRSHPAARNQVRALLSTEVVRAAFASQDISQLDAPRRVRALLLLARWRLTPLLLAALRLSGQRSRITPG